MNKLYWLNVNLQRVYNNNPLNIEIKLIKGSNVYIIMIFSSYNNNLISMKIEIKYTVPEW